MRNKYRCYKKRVMLVLLSALLFNCQSSIVNGQLSSQSSSDEALMAQAARAEGLDKTVEFQRSMEVYRQQLAGQYLFDEQLATEQAQQAYGKVVQAQGDRMLLIREIFHALPQHVRQVEINQWQ